MAERPESLPGPGGTPHTTWGLGRTEISHSLNSSAGLKLWEMLPVTEKPTAPLLVAPLCAWEMDPTPALPRQLRLQLEPHNTSLSQDMLFLLVKNADWEIAPSFLLTHGLIPLPWWHLQQLAQ